MNLGALRTFLRQSILGDRTDRTSGSSDYLWTDAELDQFINEAERILAVRGLVLRDGTNNTYTRVTLVADQSVYPLDDAVIAVISCKQEAAVNDMQRVGHPVMNISRPLPNTWSDAINSSGLTTGPPLIWSSDEQLTADGTGSLGVVNLRVHPTPSSDEAGDYLRLRVVRKPGAALSVDTDVPEVPEDHHIEMLDYAAYLALRIVDDDAGFPNRAHEFRKMFEKNVIEARKTAMRKLFAPMDIGFGRGGFSWEH